MNIISMLARLEDALGCSNLTKQMVLVPPSASALRSSKEINLIVGYNGSPRSQTALDLTLWIAHQTRLATGKQVTVQVVYVIENDCQAVPPLAHQRSLRLDTEQAMYPGAIGTSYHQGETSHRSSSAVAEAPLTSLCQLNQFDEADRILWQARHMADEWRGSLKTHLRFGPIALELQRVVEAEAAALLLLGCDSAEHLLVQELSVPCAILGIPPTATP